MPAITCTNYQNQVCQLVHTPTGTTVSKGTVLANFRGEEHTIMGGRSPHKPGSTGAVWLAGGMEFYPTVFECEWQPVGSIQ
jgi:hypothetical protein